MIVNDKDAYVGASFLTYGEFSEGEAELFRQLVKPGMTVADVGANIGAHTVLFASLVGPTGKVFAMEPQRHVFQMLAGNVALNNLDNVYCAQAGVGRESRWILAGNLDQDQENNFGGLPLGSIEGDEPIEIAPLQRHCHFVKIDVEGMELDVLKGAEKMIMECKPILYIENDREEKSAALIDAVYELGYTPYWHISALFNPNNFKGNQENIFGGQASINMLCVPQPSEVTGLNIARRGATWRHAIRNDQHIAA